uniref:Uncharacterized protein n=1 Tax=Anguilla anguilla TaxID=7936 RepID=A0A0E9RNN2_ANGAN
MLYSYNGMYSITTMMVLKRILI